MEFPKEAATSLLSQKQYTNALHYMYIVHISGHLGFYICACSLIRSFNPM